uniref:Uncharacterized protein n=1 Tax=Panagrolaimus sp. ES5 TaxID=591445 RepID=A0AC34FY69_9BILA
MARKTVPRKVNEKPAATAEKIIKASPKVEKNEKNGKKNGSAAKSAAALDDSIIKDSKASKLSQLLKKQNVSAKNPDNSDADFQIVKTVTRGDPKCQGANEIPFPERNPSNSSVCLILPDLSHNELDKKNPDVDKGAREWADILRDKFGITGHDVAKIVTLNQLKREVLKFRFLNVILQIHPCV